MKLTDKRLTALVTAFFLALYFVSALSVLFRDGFHHYVYLAEAFSRGRLDLRLPARDAHEFSDSYDDVAFHNGRFYLGLPPAPALFLLPFSPLGRSALPARLGAVVLGAASAAGAFLLLGRLGADRAKQLWLTALFGAGTVHWFVASHGSAWYLAQVAAVFFLLAALRAALGGRGLAAGLCLAGAFLSRQLTILAFPALLALLIESRPQKKTRPVLSLALGTALGVFLYLLYNWARFGDALQTGYAYHLITGDAVIQFQRYGLFHPHYLPRNLYTLLFMPPKLSDAFPYFFPSPQGMALVFTSPALVYAFRAPGRVGSTRALWFSVLLIVGLQLFYCNNGSWQFGYRFLLDALPLLMVLVARGTPSSLSRPARVLISLSVLANLYGVIMLRALA